MKRDEWEFKYGADVLAKAAEAKLKYHEGRLEWWRKQQAEIKDKIKNEGIEVDESLADPKFSSNYARQPTVQIRNDLSRDLAETADKVREHRNKIHDYSGWLQVLQSQNKDTLILHQDDWLFFFGK